MLLAALWLWLAPARGASIAAREGAPVRTVRAVARDMPRYVDTVGTVQAFNTVVVRSRVDGEIGRIAFREGRIVRKGDVLVELDRRPYEAQLRLAIAQEEKDRALLDNAQVDLARYEQLMQTDSTSRQTLDTARSLVRQLEATVKADAAQADAAKLQVEYATIRAPIDGRTGARLVDIGNMVRTTDTGGLVVVTQLDPIFVSFSLPQETLPLLRASQAVGSSTVTALSQNGSSVQGRGKLTLVDNQVDSATGTIRCKATLPNSNETLWPGQFVTARVLLETIRNVVVVPTAAVQSGPEGAFV